MECGGKRSATPLWLDHNPLRKRFHPITLPTNFKLTPQSEARRRKALEKQAAALGFTLNPAA